MWDGSSIHSPTGQGGGYASLYSESCLQYSAVMAKGSDIESGVDCRWRISRHMGIPVQKDGDSDTPDTIHTSQGVAVGHGVSSHHHNHYCRTGQGSVCRFRFSVQSAAPQDQVGMLQLNVRAMWEEWLAEEHFRLVRYVTRYLCINTDRMVTE